MLFEILRAVEDTLSGSPSTIVAQPLDIYSSTTSNFISSPQRRRLETGQP
jgi:hypothetical protein